MEKYHKIQTVYHRDPDNRYKTLLEGRYARPEFAYLAANEWVFTEKIDGTNIRVGWDGQGILFGGRSDRSAIPTFLFAELQMLFTHDLLIAEYPDLEMTLYGEGYGARIQKGGGNYISDGVGFILFDVMIQGNYQDRENVADIAAHLGLSVVPTVGCGTLPDAVEIAREGFQSLIGSQMAEGLVMRPAIELVSRIGRRIISKVKHKDFQ